MKVFAGLFVVLAVLAAILTPIGFAIGWEHTYTTQACTVESKDRTSGDHGSNVRIYTKECGVLTIADDVFQGRFNSADQYAKIGAGHTYEFKTVGWRNGFFSQFPNIINVTAK